MNPEEPKTPREEMELRLTALLLGELSVEEADRVRQAIAQDADLARLHKDLQRTIGLVRAVTNASEPVPIGTAQPRLSDERRQKLLARFKTIAPKELAEPQRRRVWWLVPVAAAAAIALCATLAIPNFVRARATAQSNAIVNNLRQLDGARDQWAIEHQKSPDDVATMEDLAPYIKGGPQSIAGERYILGKLSEPIVVEVEGGPARQRSWFRSTAKEAASHTESDSLEDLAARHDDKTVTEQFDAMGPTTAPPGQRPFSHQPAKGLAEPAAAPPGHGGVYSESVVGYTNIPLDEGIRVGADWLYYRDVEGRSQAGQAPQGATRRSDADASPAAGGAGSIVLPPKAPSSQVRADDFGTFHSGVDRDGEWVGVLEKPADGESRFGSGHATDDLTTTTGKAVSFSDLASNESAPAGATPSREPALVLGDVHAGGRLFESERFDKTDSERASRVTVTGGPLSLDRSDKNLSDSFVVAQVPELKRGIGKEQLSTVTGDVAKAKAPVDEMRIPEIHASLSTQTEVMRRLQQEQAAAEQRLTALKRELSEEHSEVKQAEANLAKVADELDRARNTGNEQVAKYRPYFDAKRELHNSERIRDALQARIAQEEIQLALPRSSSVAIVDRAEEKSAEDETLLTRARERLGGNVERSARISIAKDEPDLAGLEIQHLPAAYDPYFLQTQFEIIQSGAVLNEVVKKLNLDEAWAEKHGAGRKLTAEEAYQHLRKKIEVRGDSDNKLLDIRVKSDDPAEAAKIANTVAEVYRDSRLADHKETIASGMATLQVQLAKREQEVARAKEKLAELEKQFGDEKSDPVPAKPAAPAATPQPEVLTSDNAFSTFSLNVSDVSFKLAAASLDQGQMPEPVGIRSEEFINAFDYRDPEPSPPAPIAFAWERARYPFAHNRDLLRFSLKTAASGRQPGRPLNIVLLLDNSGSMERADRVRIIDEALRVLAAQLQPDDKLSVVTFARTAQLRVDGVAGDQAGEVAERLSGLTPQGGTNLEEAMNVAYETARRHYLPAGMNRVVLLTDGAANLGNVEPDALKAKVEVHRKQGIALDCFGIGWEGLNDDLLEILSRNGDGRYGFINTPEEAIEGFAAQLAGALNVAASDVKVQVEFNPRRVTAYRQIGYAKHQLTKEQFRDNTVDAAEIAAAESGNALYTVQVNPDGDGPLATVRVRYRIPGANDYREQEWPVPYSGGAVALEQAGSAMRLAASASAFSEWLMSSPYAGEVTCDRLLGYLRGVPEVYGPDERPKQLEWMIRKAQSISGR